MIQYDAIIIGSGQAGNPLARKLAATGRKVALIEKGLIGGTCVNVGCTPTKTLIASGRVAHLVGRSRDFGVVGAADARTRVEVDIEAVIARKNQIVLHSREANTKSLMETVNLDVVFGTAAFSGNKQIKVVKEDGSSIEMTAEWIFVNAGTRPAVPDVSGLENIPYYDSTTLQDLLEIPRHLLILGGSYIALEFGQLYRRLGSEVTIVETGHRFLPKEDEDIAAEIRTILEEEGLKIVTGMPVRAIREEKGTEAVIIELGGATDVARLAGEAAGDVGITNGGGTADGGLTITGTHLLVATGRDPNTDILQPELSGIELDKHGFIRVNERLETNVPGIYGLGDVKGGPQFTHIAYNDHLIVYKNLIEGGHESTAGREAIYCLFTDPELGRYGLTEAEAREKGLPIKVAKIPASHIARAIENGETKGLVKAIVHAETGQILGVAALTTGGGELMSILQMAMVGGVTYDRIRDMVFAHPTFAEALNNLFAKVE